MPEHKKKIHWGWYWKVKKKHRSKVTCESVHSIDSFHICKPNHAGFCCSNDKFYITAERKEKEFVVTIKDGACYSLPIEKQFCNFGGECFFFRCPNTTCKKRMRKLYFYQGYFLCRKCMKLCYYSQKITTSFRNAQMKNKIESKLKKLGGDIYEKPRWMRNKTFEKLRESYFKYNEKSEAAFEKEMAEYFGCCWKEKFLRRLDSVPEFTLPEI